MAPTAPHSHDVTRLLVPLALEENLCTSSPDSEDIDDNRRLGLSRTAEDILSSTDSDSYDEGRFLTDPDEAHTLVAPDAVIESFDSEQIASFSQDFSLVTGRKYRNTHRRMRARSPTPMINSLIWNIRGIGKAPAVRRLRKLVRVHQLPLICVLEPFISVDHLEALRVQLGMDRALFSQYEKIWVFWSAPFSVKLLHDMG